jgi:hypothetical protein
VASRLNGGLTLLAIVLALVGLIEADRLGWNSGLGYDGTVYASVAVDFPGTLAGHKVVEPPGGGPDTTPTHVTPPKGVLDGYYVKRILPSGLVYATDRALGLRPSPHTLVRVFAWWTVLMVGLAALLWCMTADHLGFGLEQKLLGWMALILNFAALKASAWSPITTDIFAYAEGAALLYFWTRSRRLGLVLTTIAGAFTWPTILLAGAILIAFPGPWRPSAAPVRGHATARWTIGVGALLGVVTTVLIVKWRSAVMTGAPFSATTLHDLAPWGSHLFGVGAVLAGIFVCWAACAFLPGLVQLAPVRAPVTPAVGVAVAVVAVVLIAQHVLARQPALLSETALFKESLPFSAAFPGLFAVTLIGYYGPLLVLGAWRWRSLRDTLTAWGPGAALMVAGVVATALLVEARKALPLYPLVIPLMVLALGELRGRWLFLAGFATVSLAGSRIWFHIGYFPFTGGAALRSFPAEGFFMATGIWTSWQMYLAQLGAIVLGGAILVALFRRPGVAEVGVA